jgi:hypothetical protein
MKMSFSQLFDFVGDMNTLVRMSIKGTNFKKNNGIWKRLQ